MKLTYYVMPIILVCTSVIADELKGLGHLYASDIPLEHNTVRRIIPRVLIDNHSVKLENDSLTQIQAALGGMIHKDSKTSWLCYHSPQHQRTWWFLSDNEMQHGKVSAIAISLLDIQAECGRNEKAIDLQSDVPGIGVSRNTINDFYHVKVTNEHNQIGFYQEKLLPDGYVQSNGAAYYFKGDYVDGIIFSQVSSN